MDHEIVVDHAIVIALESIDQTIRALQLRSKELERAMQDTAVRIRDLTADMERIRTYVKRGKGAV